MAETKKQTVDVKVETNPEKRIKKYGELYSKMLKKGK